MKKTIKTLSLLVMVILIGVVGLTGCSATPFSSYLNTVWDKDNPTKEIATYRYEYKKGDTAVNGTLTTIVYAITDKNNNFTIGGKEFTNADKGNYYEYTLEVNNGDRIFGQVYFKGTGTRPFMPVASFTERFIDGKTQTMLVNYSNDKCTATVNNNGTTANYEVGYNKNTIILDNIELHAIARTLNFSQQGTLSFSTPIFTGNGITTRALAMAGVADASHNVNGDNPDTTFSFINEGKEFKSKTVVLTINEKPAGLPQTISVCNGTVKINGVEFKQPIIKIVEGNDEKGKSTYTLTDMKKETI